MKWKEAHPRAQASGRMQAAGACRQRGAWRPPGPANRRLVEWRVEKAIRCGFLVNELEQGGSFQRPPCDRRRAKAGEGAWQKGKWKGSHRRMFYRKWTKMKKRKVVESEVKKAEEGEGFPARERRWPKAANRVVGEGRSRKGRVIMEMGPPRGRRAPRPCRSARS